MSAPRRHARLGAFLASELFDLHVNLERCGSGRLGGPGERLTVEGRRVAHRDRIDAGTFARCAGNLAVGDRAEIPKRYGSPWPEQALCERLDQH